jgi:probable biosynthetic protein (TIGR04099 family)
VPDFRDAADDPVYAAFFAVTVRDARFGAAHEHYELTFDARLMRISCTRFMSVHRLAVHGRPVGEIVMTSVFVKRTEPGLSRSIARFEVAGLPPVERAAELADHAATVAALHRDHLAEHLGFVRADAAALDRLVIDPCPAEDFNGVDFLYFSSFQALERPRGTVAAPTRALRSSLASTPTNGRTSPASVKSAFAKRASADWHPRKDGTSLFRCRNPGSAIRTEYRRIPFRPGCSAGAAPGLPHK